MCHQYIRVKHILTDCIDFSDDGNKYFKVTDLKQLLQDVSFDNILSFFKSISILETNYRPFICLNVKAINY